MTSPSLTAAKVLDALDRCAAAQRAALAEGDDDRLLAVLSDKQRVLEATDLPALLKSAPPAEAAALRERVQALIEAESAAIETATARRDEVGAEITEFASVRPARNAYSGDDDAVAPRRLDVGG